MKNKIAKDTEIWIEKHHSIRKKINQANIERSILLEWIKNIHWSRKLRNIVSKTLKLSHIIFRLGFPLGLFSKSEEIISAITVDVVPTDDVEFLLTYN